MKLTLPLAASTGAETDYLLLGLVGVSIAVLALVFGLMLLYVIRYRHNSPIDRGDIDGKNVPVRDQLDRRHTGRSSSACSSGDRSSTSASFSRPAMP